MPNFRYRSFGWAVDALFNLAFGEGEQVNARGIGGFALKSEFARETEKGKREGEMLPLR